MGGCCLQRNPQLPAQHSVPTHSSSAKLQPLPQPFSEELNRHSLATHKQGQCRYDLLYLPCKSNSSVCTLQSLPGQAVFLARELVVSNTAQPQYSFTFPVLSLLMCEIKVCICLFSRLYQSW